MVSGNVGQVREIFLNLLVNAVQAMAGRGQLNLSTRADGRRVEVLIGDTGPGVPPDAVGRIFEPFFTTKGGAQGTGLGLAISTEIAHEHGGSIELLHSSAGRRHVPRDAAQGTPMTGTRSRPSVAPRGADPRRR